MTLADIQNIDTEGMYDAIRTFPDQWRDARQRALAADYNGIRNNGHTGLVVAGMGGSAIGGDMLRAMALPEATVPVTVVRSYDLPAWISASTTVIVSSYSGNTEETLSAMDEALARKAQVICITTGGSLATRAHKRGLPVITLPAGLQPRAALGYSLAAVLTVAEHLGILTIEQETWEEVTRITREQAQAFENPEDPHNQAMKIALALQDKFPVIYSSENLEVVNVRWRNQIHENAKTFAVGNLLPEMNHNEIMGWDRQGRELRYLGVVVLRDSDDHERVQRRIDVTASLLKNSAGYWTELSSLGKSRLARFLSLIYISDWVSLYLAILHKTDPSPVGLISQLKQALANGS